MKQDDIQDQKDLEQLMSKINFKQMRKKEPLRSTQNILKRRSTINVAEFEK